MREKQVVKTRINWAGITWLLLIAVSVVFFFIAIHFIAFPQKYILPLGIALLIMDLIMSFLSLRRKRVKKNSPKRSQRKPFVTFMNLLLSALLIAGSVYLPALQAKMEGIFIEPAKTQEVKVSAYVLTSDYKEAHSDVFSDTNTSDDFGDYQDKKFITQTSVDQENQTAALEKMQKKLKVNSLDLLEKSDVISAVSALYDGSGDVLVLNDAFVNSICDISGYENFATDTKVIYTAVRLVEADSTHTISKKYTDNTFCMYIAGSDTRSSALEYYTRTDVNMILTVDPINKQILLVAVPRDWYVKNPGLGNGLDKLTHLGNNGLQNSVDGLNQEFNFDYIKDYFEVNFVTFHNIVDAIDGIDIDNPYEFTNVNGDGQEIDGGTYGGSFTYAEGNIHLDGNEALSYVRERYGLPDGDIGRNQHESIVLQAIIKKLTSEEIISNFNTLLDKLQDNFLTSVSSNDIYSLARMQLNDGGEWNFISYHLGGTDGMAVTASMGSQELYVSYPIDDQVAFAKEQITKVMNGESITQETLPGETTTDLSN